MKTVEINSDKNSNILGNSFIFCASSSRVMQPLHTFVTQIMLYIYEWHEAQYALTIVKMQGTCLKYVPTKTVLIRTSSSAIAKRPRCGWVSYGQKLKTRTGRQYFTDIIGLSSTTVTAKQSSSVKKRKIRAITPFKVIQGHRPGRHQSKARMRLPISD